MHHGEDDKMTVLESRLVQHAIELGVSDACLMEARRIRIEEELAALCREGCPSYGQSANCPPHVMPPAVFRKMLDDYPQALVFKFDVPTEVLLGEGRFEVARLVHETAAALEGYALTCGYAGARGFAAGSCRRNFCAQEKDCRVLTEGGDCRHPDAARPSISGLGVHFFALSRTLGWPIHKMTRESAPGDVPMGLMAGIVLLALHEGQE
jgi:predicted metal-binding protein